MRFQLEYHDQGWVRKFSEIRDSLREVLQDVRNATIEHVGSTSIPGLVAKPVIDIDVIVSASSLEHARAALVNAGYTDCGECGVPGRWQFRQPGYGRYEPAHGYGRNGELRHNLYVVVEGCTALRNHLDVKRVLLEDEELSVEYAAVKENLRERDFENVGEYVRAKTEILCKILRRAGWSEEELREVVQANS